MEECASGLRAVLSPHKDEHVSNAQDNKWKSVVALHSSREDQEISMWAGSRKAPPFCSLSVELEGFLLNLTSK